MPKFLRVAILIAAILAVLGCSSFIKVSHNEFGGLPVLFTKGDVKFFSNGQLTVEITYVGEGDEPWLCGDYTDWSSCEVFLQESAPDWDNPGLVYISTSWREVEEMPQPAPLPDSQSS